MDELTIIKRDNGAYIDSREVAVAIGKEHCHLLRDIRGYCRIIEKNSLSKIGLPDFFIESSYISSRGKLHPCYLISKMGCEIVANKLTGEKGVLFTAAYVKKFNEMETAEHEAAPKATARPRLGEFNSAVRNVLNGMNYCCVNPNRVMSFLSGVYKPLGIEVCEADDYVDDFYSVTSIARLLKVYSKNGRPHGHAISSIIAKLNVPKSKVIVVPYGLVGMMVKYEWSVVQSVKNWLEEHGKPNEIPHYGFKYHIYYVRQLSFFDDDYDIIDLNDDDEFFTAEELDEMCGQYDDCDECPGVHLCCDDD